MRNRPNDFHIVTGGPGSGKSSLLAALSGEGYRHMPEAGRAIIQDQVAIGGTALPWADRESFATLMLNWDMRSYQEALDADGTIFFDRGIPDLVGYWRLCGLPVPDHALRAAELFRYNRRVFIAPHWPEIFHQDAERKQNLEEAEATVNAIASAYVELGYELIELPKDGIAERAHFVLANLFKPRHCNGRRAVDRR